MKTILVPTDLSAKSENTINYAAEIARLAKAKLILFHVYSIPVPISDVQVAEIPIDEIEKQCITKLKATKKKLANKYKEVEIEVMVKAGLVVSEILEIMEERLIDMVVMGINGGSKYAGIFGSNTAAIMKKSKSIVLGIPAGVKFTKPEKLALACDYLTIVPDEVTDKLKYFVHLFQSKLFIFNVLKKSAPLSYQKVAAEVNLENSLCDIGHVLYYPSGENIPEEANKFVEQNNIDMLVTIPHNYEFMKSIAHQSTSKKMVFQTNVPMLSIHE